MNTKTYRDTAFEICPLRRRRFLGSASTINIWCLSHSVQRRSWWSKLWGAKWDREVSWVATHVPQHLMMFREAWQTGDMPQSTAQRLPKKHINQREHDQLNVFQTLHQRVAQIDIWNPRLCKQRHFPCDVSFPRHLTDFGATKTRYVSLRWQIN